ncbi:MAG: hypothetical protein WA766_04925 [Candidatus Acidiferrales bacterium]|jgi:hypothetical protein
MTFEKKCLIEPSDFVSVQYECAKCHSAILVPIEKLDSEQAASFAIAGCSFCKTPSGLQAGTQEMMVFLEFISSLKTIAGVLKGRNLRVRLGIECAE